MGPLSLLHSRIQASPDRPFVRGGASDSTYAEIGDSARVLAAQLRELGIEPGDRVCISIPNRLDFIRAYYGALEAGATVVPVNASSPAPELVHVATETRARVLITHDAELGRTVAATCAHELIVIDPVVNLDWDSNSPDTDPHPPAVDDADAVILFTSGTTGQPRGARLSNRNVDFIARVLAGPWRIGPDDVLLIVGPASHIFGQAMINVAVRQGAAISLVEQFSPAGLFSTIERDRVTFIAGVPTLGDLMLRSPLSASHDLSSLKMIMIAGANMPPGMAEALRSTLSVDVVTGYGMTEAVPITLVTADMTDLPDGTVGRPVSDTKIRLVDDGGHDVPAGEFGEIVVIGPQVTSGYFGREAGTDWFDGWFRTGDIGRFDPDGNLFLGGRLKSMLKVAGYSVFPAEVERVLMEHPDVSMAAVVGVPHQSMGEIVVAFVQTTADLSSRDLAPFCRERLARHKRPSRFVIRDTLPLGPTGKVATDTLRSEFINDNSPE